jgi:AraC-like DNA-binding protein
MFLSKTSVTMPLTGAPPSERPANSPRVSMRLPLKRKLAIGATVTAAAAFAGGAYAATQSGGTSRQAFLGDVAKRLGVSPKQLTDALKGAFDDQLAAAVAAGKLTQAQANAIKRRVPQKGGPPFGFGGARRFGAPRLFGGPGHPFPGAHEGRFAAAAKYLGLTEAQLAKQLAAGKSLAQIASARGKSVSGLKAAMTAAVKARLDKTAAAKMLTSAQEQQILSRLSSVLDAQINDKGFAPRFRQQGFRRGFGPGGMRVYPGVAPQGALPAPPPPGLIY